MINNESLSNITNGNNNCCFKFDNSSNNIRRSNDSTDTFSDSERNEDNDKQNFKSNSYMPINIFRFKFTNEFINDLFKFSKIHQYDHRKEFKEAWEIWIEENNIIIKEEIERLKNLGYEGNIIEKMYKSARYYFRKKSMIKKEPMKRRNYISINKDLLDTMDEFIEISLRKCDANKPSDSFEEFCQLNKSILKDSINLLLLNGGFKDEVEIKKKIKKTYKNRYFLIKNQK